LGALAILPLTTSAAEKSVGTGPSFKGPIGLQLYSLRNEFKKDGVEKTLDTVKGFGVRYAELAGTYGLTPEQFLPQLKARGIIGVSTHFPYELYRDNPEEAAQQAKALGLKYAGLAWIPHKGDFDEKTCRAAAAVFNHAGEVLAKHGIQFFYHTHGYEYQPFGDGTLFDLLMKETNPKYVSFEMDIMWTVFPGQDPAKLFQKYPKRWSLVHLKDLKKGVQTGALTGHTDVSNDVALGTGQMDWPSILSAAKKAGVKYYFIEDESPSSVQQIPQSLKFMEQVRF
jgi:sugar phosphate isomerase/epimerase